MSTGLISVGLGIAARLAPILTVLLFTVGASAQKVRVPTLYLVGDSTMAEKLPAKRPETGWGEMLGKHFRAGSIRVDNRAANGRSTKTFISEGRWKALTEGLAKGDYVFIQFGHNDSSKDKGDRYTPPGDYRANLIRFVEETRAVKATPVLLTPVVRRRFDKDSKFYDTHGEYPGIVRAVATSLKVPLIDMQHSSQMLLTKQGPMESRKLYLQLQAGENVNYPAGIEDNTHFSPAGAEQIALLAVQAIRESKLPLKKLLRK